MYSNVNCSLKINKDLYACVYFGYVIKLLYLHNDNDGRVCIHILYINNNLTAR